MGNLLFQMAEDFVKEAASCTTYNAEKVYKAQNALSSAYANSTEAEKRQLREFQAQLDSVKDTH